MIILVAQKYEKVPFVYSTGIVKLFLYQQIEHYEKRPNQLYTRSDQGGPKKRPNPLVARGSESKEGWEGCWDLGEGMWELQKGAGFMSNF